MDAIEKEARFLIDRLRALEEHHMSDEFFRDWNGHVCPSIRRLELLLGDGESENGGDHHA